MSDEAWRDVRRQVKRRICIFTGSRADYGPMVPLLRRLRDDPETDLQIVVSGGHLVPDQGMTVSAIEADGFVVNERVDMVLAGDSSAAASKSFALGCIGCGDALDRLQPDIMVVLGDRYEVLAAVIAALPRLVPVAHIAGGQLSLGSIDDEMRHAITKLAHLHFTIEAEDRCRILRMGENPDAVFHVGMIGLDSSAMTDLLNKEEMESAVGIELRPPVLLVTHHPATADLADTRGSCSALLKALDHYPEATVVLTAPNVDTGAREIGESLRKYAASRERAIFTPSLGQQKYLSMLKIADAVVGNSSSGINEAPAFGTPTVNIGRRQEGRKRARTVIDCGDDSAEIADAIGRALAADRRGAVSEDTSRGLDLMVEKLKHVELLAIREKRFMTQPHVCESCPV